MEHLPRVNTEIAWPEIMNPSNCTSTVIDIEALHAKPSYAISC